MYNVWFRSLMGFCYWLWFAAARNLGVPQIKSDTHNQKVINDDLKVHDEEHFSSTDDLGAMDYTPASKKPPIHN